MRRDAGLRVTRQQGYRETIQHAWARSWARPGGRWPWARWAFSLLLPLALLLWSLSLFLAPGDPPLLEIDVVSQTTGRGIDGALVRVGDASYRADGQGMVILPPQSTGSRVVASAEGHETVTDQVEDSDGDMVLSLSGVLVLGSVSDAVSGVPVEGASIAIIDCSGQEVTTTHTDESGTFVFTMIPEDAELVLQHDIYGERREPIGTRRELRIQLSPPAVTGQVVDAAGTPVAGAVLAAGQVQARTDENGAFRLNGVGQGAELTIEGPGRSLSVEVRGSDLGTITLADATPAAVASPESGAP